MPKQDWCALCVAERIRKHGRFEGNKGLLPAVTTIRGTRYCGIHGEEVLQGVLMRADIEAHEATVLDSPALHVSDMTAVERAEAMEEASIRG